MNITEHHINLIIENNMPRGSKLVGHQFKEERTSGCLKHYLVFKYIRNGINYRGRVNVTRHKNGFKGIGFIGGRR